MIAQITGPEYACKALLEEPPEVPENVLTPGRGL